LDEKSASHPSLTLLSQSPNPMLQVMLHAPPPHAGAPFVDEQAWPQAPQFRGSSAVFDSQPSAGWPSQSLNPRSQLATTQLLAMHAAVACARLHAAPHAPQLPTLVA